MEGEHVHRSFVGGFDDSRDTRSKYNGDPFFQLNSNQLGMTLLSSMLTDSNYLVWSCSIRAKVKLCFFNDKCDGKYEEKFMLL